MYSSKVYHVRGLCSRTIAAIKATHAGIVSSLMPVFDVLHRLATCYVYSHLPQLYVALMIRTRQIFNSNAIVYFACSTLPFMLLFHSNIGQIASTW